MIDAHPCPCCGLEWETNCEQHICIQLFGECIVCRFLPTGKGSRSGSLADMDRITARRRELITGSITSVEEDGDTMTIKAELPPKDGVREVAPELISGAPWDGRVSLDVTDHKPDQSPPSPRSEGEDVHRILDEEGTPRKTAFGTTLTLWGRINFYFGRRPEVKRQRARGVNPSDGAKR